MAETIPAFTIRPRRTGPSKFDGFLDGQKWRLSVPEDGACLETLRRSLYRRGKILNKRVRIVVFDRANALEVQARPVPGLREGTR
jgi:hypothetical protein